MGQGSGKRWLVIAGPTGSGKSALALALAEVLGGEIIGCDSVQLYQGFDIGSAKPSPAERRQVPHHLVDVLAWHEDCDAARYAALARSALEEVSGRGRLPIVVGGTGLYLRALLGKGWHADLPKDEALRERLKAEDTATLHARLTALDPERAAALHPHDRFRVIRALELVTLLGKTLKEAGLEASQGADPEACVLVLDPPREELHRRIEARTVAMLRGGLEEEVRGLLAAGVSPDCKPMGSIGYKEVVQVLRHDAARSELGARIAAATRQYAKRQCTWNRKVQADVRLGVGEVGEALAFVRASFPDHCL